MSEKFDALMDSWKGMLKFVLEPVHHVFDFLSNAWISAAVVTVVFLLVLGYCVIKYGAEFKQQIRKPRTMVICAMMVTLNIVLGYFNLWLSSYLRVGFGFVTQPVVTMMFGPLAGCVTGVFQDILSYMLNPVGGAYMPTYSMCVGISGMIYGFVLYRRPVTLWRVFLAKLLVIVLSNILLNSIALAPTVGSGFIGILPARILKNLLLLPIQTAVVYAVLKFAQQFQLFKARA
ncbi:folate family ECF transporter S component [Ructibacterium gallinarum]|uniref:Folate family ECF transporter S component n=1 Tax=Ructibacterium gallinarum TaxID=2779355 RepID=A0A9D5RAP1_9FIRM|nr:folate family ECF transporter S component [Ructibacterium gallinarum]MBE5039283.1 folate family ECF transporter S component [Ructibacterium gallinarum]